MKQSDTASFDSNPELQKGKGKESTQPPATAEAEPRFNHEMAQLLAASDAILLMLKIDMRTRSAEMAISFLYGNNMGGESFVIGCRSVAKSAPQDIQISFHYDRLPPKHGMGRLP
jgi:hypothetical protein